MANELIADSRLAFLQGKYDESLKLAKQALTEDEKSADAHQCAGNAYMLTTFQLSYTKFI